MTGSSNDNLSELREYQLDLIIDEIKSRQKSDSQPKLEEFTKRYPDYAESIAGVWPALMAFQHVVSDLRADTQVIGTRYSLQNSEFPERLGDFELIREIGRGGMGVVYLAKQISLDRIVALKVLSRSLSADPKFNTRFLREAQSAARLQHPHIVPVFGNGNDQGCYFYSMQWIDGASLSAVLEEVRQLKSQIGTPLQNDSAHSNLTQYSRLLFHDPSNEITKDLGTTSNATSIGSTVASSLDSKVSGGVSSLSFVDSHGGKRAYFRNVAMLAKQVAEALHYSHSQKIIHRDIKPSNLLLDQLGSIWVTDFGLAKLESQSALTKHGDVIGTLRYVAPEQLSGIAAPSCDIYGLGATLYEMITLKPVIDANDHVQIFEQIRNRDPIAPTKIDRSIPLDLETIALKAIAKPPGSRYRTALDMAEDLQRFLDGRPIKARQVGELERIARWCRRNPAIASLLGVIFIIFLAGFTGVWTQWLRAEARAMAEATARADSEQALYRSNIARAQLEWHANNVLGSEQILDRCPPLLRNWEWHFLKKLNHTELRSLAEHRSWVYDVAYSPKGDLLASAGAGNPYWQSKGAATIQPGEVFLWDAKTGVRIRDLRGHTNDVCALDFNSDGSRLVTVGADRLIKLWDTTTGKETHVDRRTRWRHSHGRV